MDATDHDTLLVLAREEYSRYHPAWLLTDSPERIVSVVAAMMGVNGCKATFGVRKCVVREVIEKERKQQLNQQERISAMASIMVTARQASEDVGELLAASLKTAARKLGNAGMLVSGRPGSWEADIVMRMAQTGGYGGNQEYVEALSILFALMGDAHADGGDELSHAMSEAVDTLGGLDAFAGTSQWYHDLINIGCQYSKYEFSSASVYNLDDIDDGGKA